MTRPYNPMPYNPNPQPSRYDYGWYCGRPNK
jgi:hypothetical protein